jgi:autotransporter-associated beta strand protein
VFPLSTTVTNDSPVNYRFSGGPIAMGSLIKSGSGILTIDGLVSDSGTVVANTYSGGTIMNAGTLHLGGMYAGISPDITGTVGTGPVTLNGGIIRFDRVTETNALIVNGGTLYSQNGWGVRWNGPITLNGTLTCQTAYGMTYGGAISGTGGLLKTGSDKLTLSVSNSYTGPTTVTSGTVQCDNRDALGNGGALTIASNAKVNLNYTGDHGVPALTLGGVAQLPGSHGSSSSGALFPNDTYFSGTGTVTVAGVVKPLILAFGLPNNPAVIDQMANTITLRVPYGTDVANLAPTYTLSYGTCTPASGSTQNFTSPVTYAASSGALTNTYVVTVSVRPQVPPMSITDGLVMWLDASQLTGLSDSDPMTTWTDMSGLGNHATKTAGSPKYKTGALGGQPVVQFVKANGDKFTTADLSSQFPTAATMLIVSTLRAANAYTLVKTDTGNNHDEWWRYDGNGNSYPAAFRNQRLEAYCAMPNSGSHVFAVSSSDSWQMWVDGSSPGVALGNYSPGTTQDIGAGASGRGLEGDIAEVLSYNRTLSNDELNYLGYYLTAKYDLNSAYTVGNSITSFTVPEQTSSVIAGTNIYVTVPSGTALNSLTPTITVSIGATVTPASGVARDFSSPQVTYTVQAQDGTTKAYSVTVMDSSKRISGNIGSSGGVPLDGPAGGSGDLWNDDLGLAPATGLWDGAGVASTVGYTSGGTSWGGPDSWGTPTLELLRQGLRNFTTLGGSQYITFTDLPYRKYNVYIASANCLAVSSLGNNQRGNGVWSTPNTTSTPGDHKCSNVTAVNGSTWVEGNNYVAFLNVLPDDTGKITINGYGIPVDTYDCRLPLNGFQLVDVGTAPLRSGKAMSNVFFPGLGFAYADSTGTNLFLQVPIGTSVTALAPTYTVSMSATGNPVSGTTRDFTTKQTYIITAEDLSQQAYSVTVAPVAAGLGYSALVLAAGPVAFWPLGEFTGTTAADITGHGHDATYDGSVTLGVAGLVPRSSSAAAGFRGGTATAPYSASLNPNQWTVECWVKPIDSTVQYLVSLQDRTTGSRWGYAIWKNNGGTGFGMQWGTGATTTDSMNSPNAAVSGNAYHVVGTYDGSTFSLYVNGNLDISKPGPAYQPASPTQPGFTIGSRNGITAAPSDIQCVAVYNRALTPAEIQTHYQNTPILKVGTSAGQVILNWEPGIMLQHAAPNVMGPYNDVPSATSPWPITPAGTSEFWRLKTQ